MDNSKLSEINNFKSQLDSKWKEDTVVHKLELKKTEQARILCLGLIEKTQHKLAVLDKTIKEKNKLISEKRNKTLEDWLTIAAALHTKGLAIVEDLDEETLTPEIKKFLPAKACYRKAILQFYDEGETVTVGRNSHSERNGEPTNYLNGFTEVNGLPLSSLFLFKTPMESYSFADEIVTGEIGSYRTYSIDAIEICVIAAEPVKLKPGGDSIEDHDVDWEESFPDAHDLWIESGWKAIVSG